MPKNGMTSWSEIYLNKFTFALHLLFIAADRKISKWMKMPTIQICNFPFPLISIFIFFLELAGGNTPTTFNFGHV